MADKHSYNDAPTPMLRQYLKIKEGYPDSILLFRLGDFYEMFFDDAKIASNILDITLTSRNKNDKNSIPLCGVPYHSIEPYISKLLENGRKVAICEQMEDPKTAKGIVKREVTRLLTPGVIVDGLGLSEEKNNYIIGICLDGSKIGMAIADASTGYFRATDLMCTDELIEEMIRIEPSEVFIDVKSNDNKDLKAKIGLAVPGIVFTKDPAIEADTSSIAELSGGENLIENQPLGARAASTLLSYIEKTQRGPLRQLASIKEYSNRRVMRLDESTIRNLELIRTITGSDRQGSIFEALDRTRTAVGTRKLKRWILYPLIDAGEINGRLSVVDEVLKDHTLRSDLPSHLSEVYDIERLLGRMNAGTANARDLIALKNSLDAIGKVRALIDSREGMLGLLASKMDTCDEVLNEITAKIVDDPPFTVREGRMIRKTVDEDLDELRDIIASGKDYIASIESTERERTGISSLKIKYNKVFGYYLEVTNTHKEKVPLDYIRKQTLANAERYITPELKEYEQKVLGAEEKVRAREYEIFKDLRERVSTCTGVLQKTADAVATLDVLQSFATIAAEFDYVRPIVNDSSEIDIKDGRHPIVERLNPIERFVPNDLLIDASERRMLIITGPNMAGKSTAMRQTALIVLMAQIGCFVPAKEAMVGVVDRIFTRVGASDMLSRGQSTFMVEMSEAALILKNATKKSLIIIDEIGRGTSTYDGLAIAWAIAEDLHDRVAARTLFATHYHELTDLAATKMGIHNMQIAVREWNDEVVFLRKLISGATSRSYGIQVGRLAGLPANVIERADEVLENLEEGEFDEIGRPRIAVHHGDELMAKDGAQFQLFCQAVPHEVSEILTNTDTSTITPIEALNLLHTIKQKL